MTAPRTYENARAASYKAGATIASGRRAPFTTSEVEWLRNIFPTGVCDYSSLMQEGRAASGIDRCIHVPLLAGEGRAQRAG